MRHPVLCARAAALLHLHAMPASLWEARRGVCIYASESEVIYNSATESVPCGSVDDGLTYNCLCNDVNLAEEKTEIGCHCRYGWTGSSDDLRCEEFCCNPDSDPGGNWCIVADEECQGSQCQGGWDIDYD